MWINNFSQQSLGLFVLFHAQEMVYVIFYCGHNGVQSSGMFSTNTQRICFPTFLQYFPSMSTCRTEELELSSQLYSILFLFPPTFNNNQNFTFSGKFCLQEKKCFHATNFTTQIYQTNTYDFTFASHSEVSKCWGPR